MTGRGVRADAGASLVVVGEAGAGAGSGLCGCRGVGLESEFFDALEQLGIDRIGQRRRQLLRRGQVTALAAHTVDRGTDETLELLFIWKRSGEYGVKS